MIAIKKRLFAAILLLLLLLPCTAHADILFSSTGIRNAFLEEDSVMLKEGANEFIALTDLTGWAHPHSASKVGLHEKGRALRIRCLYTDERGNVWALHPHVQEIGSDCWLACEGLAPLSANPLPEAPDELPVPQCSSRTRILLAGSMILIVCPLTLILLRRIKGKRAPHDEYNP